MKNYLKLPILVASVLAGFNALSLVNYSGDDVYRTDALSYKTLQSIENKAVIEFENENHNLPDGESANITYSKAKSYKNDSYPITRLYAARMYTGNYSCSPINEVEQEVYLNGEVKTKKVNTIGGYVLNFDSEATVSVNYTSSKQRYADLYVRVSNNNYGYSQTSKPFNTQELQLNKMMSITHNSEALTISDKAMVFGRYYKDHTIVEDDINDKVKFAYEKDSSGNWNYKTTELNMYGRYLYQDWQTVLVGKILINEGSNSFVYKAINSNRSGQLDCMILDFSKYENKDVYEFEDATLADSTEIKTVANDSNELISDFATYNEDYACSNHDFVKYAKQGATMTFSSINKNSFTNPHLILRVSSVSADQNKYITNTVKVNDYLKVEINGSELSYTKDLYIEGRNDSLNPDPDGISHGIVGSLNDGTSKPNSYKSYRYLYVIWRTIDLGPITLNSDETNTIKFTIIGGGSAEYIAFDYLSIEEVEDDRYAANSFANSYLGRFAKVCNPNGNSNVSNLNKIWTDMKSSYTGLSADSKTIILNSEAVYGSQDPIERLLERYDYIGGKYNTQLVDDGDWNFLGRSVITTSTYPLPRMSLTNNNYLLLIIVVVGSSLSIAAFILIYKKNKYKRQK